MFDTYFKSYLVILFFFLLFDHFKSLFPKIKHKDIIKFKTIDAYLTEAN